jgi:hypothetical protein
MASLRLASSTALPVIFDDCATCRLSSPMEAISCSAAEATVCKPVLASSAAEATAADCWLLWLAVPVIDSAVASTRWNSQRASQPSDRPCSRRVCRPIQGRLLLGCGLELDLLLLDPQTFGLSHAVPERQHGTRHGADFILPFSTLDVGR